MSLTYIDLFGLLFGWNCPDFSSVIYRETRPLSTYAFHAPNSLYEQYKHPQNASLSTVTNRVKHKIFLWCCQNKDLKTMSAKQALLCRMFLSVPKNLSFWQVNLLHLSFLFPRPSNNADALLSLIHLVCFHKHISKWWGENKLV